MHNKTYAAEIAHNVSSRNRIVILERCVVLSSQSFALLKLCYQGKSPWRQGHQLCRSSSVRGVEGTFLNSSITCIFSLCLSETCPCILAVYLTLCESPFKEVPIQRGRHPIDRCPIPVSYHHLPRLSSLEIYLINRRECERLP